MRLALALAGALLVAAAPAAAQDEPVVHTGDRVRAWVPYLDNDREIPGASRYYTGTVQQMDRESLTLREEDGTTVNVPYASMGHLHVSGGRLPADGLRRRSTFRGAAIGGGLGAGSVLLMAAITGFGDHVLRQPDGCALTADGGCAPVDFTVVRANWPRAFGLATVAGGVAGAVIGYLGAPGRERWIGVRVSSLRLQAAPRADGGAALSLAF